MDWCFVKLKGFYSLLLFRCSHQKYLCSFFLNFKKINKKCILFSTSFRLSYVLSSNTFHRIAEAIRSPIIRVTFNLKIKQTKWILKNVRFAGKSAHSFSTEHTTSIFSFLSQQNICLVMCSSSLLLLQLKEQMKGKMFS